MLIRSTPEHVDGKSCADIREERTLGEPDPCGASAVVNAAGPLYNARRMPRDSRPPGFDMTYKPQRRKAYGPPALTWVLPSLYFVLSLTFFAVVMLGQFLPSSTWLFRYIVEGDEYRIVGARTLGLIMLAGGVAALVRTSMRGVVVHPDGIEARYVISLGWPKVKNCTWMEIDRLIFDRGRVILHLWDGTIYSLPDVRDRDGLSQALEKVATARAIPVRGGSGRNFDLDD